LHDNGNPRTVFVDALGADFDGFRGFTGARTGGPLLFLKFFGYEDADVFAGDLRGGIPEHVLGAPVPGEDVSGGVLGEDGVVRTPAMFSGSTMNVARRAAPSFGSGMPSAAVNSRLISASMGNGSFRRDARKSAAITVSSGRR
jgi:hypothetical protein